eukprot:gene19322-biopygen6000
MDSVLTMHTVTESIFSKVVDDNRLSVPWLHAHQITSYRALVSPLVGSTEFFGPWIVHKRVCPECGGSDHAMILRRKMKIIPWMEEKVGSEEECIKIWFGGFAPKPYLDALLPSLLQPIRSTYRNLSEILVGGYFTVLCTKVWATCVTMFNSSSGKGERTPSMGEAHAQGRKFAKQSAIERVADCSAGLRRHANQPWQPVLFHRSAP